MDEATRDSHIQANGQVRFTYEPFNVGGALLTEPRDPDGPPEEVFNCRCHMDEYPLSQLPQDLLVQVEGRLTDEQRRFLGVRVADTSGDVPGGLDQINLQIELALGELELVHNIVEYTAPEKINENSNNLIDSYHKIIRDNFGNPQTPQEQKKVLEAIKKEIEYLEGLRKQLGVHNGIGLFDKDQLSIIPKNTSEKRGPRVLGKTFASTNNDLPLAIGIAADINKSDVRNAKRAIGFAERPSSVAGYEESLDEEKLLETMIRHEIAHALIRRKVPDKFEGFFNENGGGEWFQENLSLRSADGKTRSQQMREAFAEAFAWFTSPDYPRNGFGENNTMKPRLPHAIEEAILDALRRGEFD